MTSLESALHRIAADLTRSHVGLALVGGLAVSVRTEPRFTRYADLAVAVMSDAEGEALIRQLRTNGYEVATLVEQEGRATTSDVPRSHRSSPCFGRRLQQKSQGRVRRWP